MTSRIPGQPLGLVWGKATPASVQLEVFVDFACPFSRRIFRRLTKEVHGHYGEQVSISFFLVPQPWHPQGCTIHECFLAAMTVAPEKRMDLLRATMKVCETPAFTDVHSYDKSRADIHKEFSEIYENECGLDSAKFLQAVGIREQEDGSVNNGNEATRTVKFYVKLHRQLGIHVS